MLKSIFVRRFVKKIGEESFCLEYTPPPVRFKGAKSKGGPATQGGDFKKHILFLSREGGILHTKSRFLPRNVVQSEPINCGGKARW
ncbi:hypothetical protein CON71_30210 [Bacillus thuringiensis]|uniref:Uncharacterized protein n=1 Tax=Bacillus thuringiensis TaxID=1428 RepID=A0A9X6THH3_BACTU|nr:hypothetical protein CON71_30210 [Bacillus thuringiensis]